MATIKVVFWSGTGNTEEMAGLVAQGIEAGGAEAQVLNVEETSVDECNGDTVLALGCPAMGDEELEEVMEDFFTALDLSGKKIGLFGSYSWNEGEWMEIWKGRVTEAGATLVGTAVAYEAPEDESADACVELGKALATA